MQIKNQYLARQINAMQCNAMQSKEMPMQYNLETLKTPNRRNFKTNPIKGMSELHVNIYTKKLSLSAALLGNMSLTV